MANKFDTTTAPQGEPVGFVVGDFCQWTRADLAGDYPVADYSAEYVARLTAGGSEIRIAATGAYLFQVTSTASAAYTPGVYHWQLEITQTSSGNRVVVSTGDFTVAADLDADGTDPRSHAQIMVTKIESLLAGKADSDVSNYSIAGRSLTKMAFQELIDARDYYRREVVKLGNEANAKRGIKGNSTIKVRF